MNRIKIYTFLYVVIFIIIGLFAGSCSDELDVTVAKDIYSEYITFSTTVDNIYATTKTRSTNTNISSEEEEWLYCGNQIEITRGAPVTSVNDSVGLIGYKIPKNESMNDSQTSWNLMTNQKYILEGDELRAASAPIPWSKVDADESLKVYAYSPYNNASLVTEITGIPTINVVVNKNIANQTDIIVADTIVKPNNQKKNIPLTFNHILTAVRFKTHLKCKVVSITLKNIKNSGTYIFGKEWTVNNNSLSDYKVSFGDEGKEFEKDSLVTFGDSTMMMIPQKLSDNATVELVYIPNGQSEKKTITASLKGKEWKQGKMITYTMHDESLHNFVYLDLAAGNVEITASTIKGYYYQKKDNGQQTLIKYEDYKKPHRVKNIYYIYQSTAANRGTTGLFINGTDSTWVLPKYPEVTWNGKKWSEFITNNDSVEEVIEAWDNAAGAGKTTSSNKSTPDKIAVNNAGAAGAVRNAGREATKNRITVSGVLDTVNVTIDNVYSSYQEAFNRGRTKGGIAYLPSQTAGDSHLIINLVGDNRFGCIHYYNSIKNRNALEIEGTGSLTVADADFYIASNDYSVKGYYSNRSCSAIGAADNPGDDHAYNIKINSGTIYAGATKAEFCTAIGGGGNGHSSITINGGVVTAVASATGTAIGGGTGLQQAGGEGTVIINNANVYAYNLKNCVGIPTSAIGGAGSRDMEGANAFVDINGGYVYAYSALGTAIGGGSSEKKKGGDATINIKDGQVIAISDVSIGIGGGSACTGGAETGGYNGGTAHVTLNGSPIIRTGSIGGGLTFCDNGKMGSADIKIYGGDIQAQFILAAGSTGRPSFYMEGGIIRNSDVNDKVYKHVRDYGGAVYLEDGKFEMIDGLIKDCQAKKGGAVYIIGDENTSFKMSGGIIEDCIAKSDEADGGALYLEGGSVIVNGTAKIKENIANGGNGGGICIKQGNFTMGDSARIEFNSSMYEENNTVKYGGNGGGVYITSTEAATVELKSGYITDNTASRKGGGVCVEMPQDDKMATVTIGIDDEYVNYNPILARNICLSQGGGLYVSGKQSYVTIYDGDITNNTTISYVPNNDVANERGMVDLVAGNVTHVTVTFDGNGATINNDGETKTSIQKIVTATNSLLVTPKDFVRMGYNFVGWNTRKDGNGETFTDGQLMNIDNNITLYALWEIQGSN